jgi:chlorobactene glucosyltransferase
MTQLLANNFLRDLIVFQGAVLLILLGNLWLLRRSRRHAPPHTLPLVSVMVPARNEEKNIRRCVQSLLAQEYPAFEVLVLDDQSNDGTLAILQEMAATQTRLRVLDGKPGTGVQAGKNWACCQLARQGRGDLFLFTDADTVHRPDSLKQLVTAAIGEDADLLTGFPHQQTLTWGERLLVPFFSWASLCFLPLGLAYRLRSQALSVAVGQVMLFQRRAYETIGGHASLGALIVDDLALARKIKAAGLRWRVARVADLVSCRMYRSGREAVQGFTKNLFAAFDCRLLPFLFVFGWLVVVFWAPLLNLAVYLLGGNPPGTLQQAGFCIFLSFLLWMVPYVEFQIPQYLGLIYPVTILAITLVALKSLFYSLTGKLSWKDRPLHRPKWRWL